MTLSQKHALPHVCCETLLSIRTHMVLHFQEKSTPIRRASPVVVLTGSANFCHRKREVSPHGGGISPGAGVFHTARPMFRRGAGSFPNGLPAAFLP